MTGLRLLRWFLENWMDLDDDAMTDRDPEKNFEELWKTFRDRYPFFELRNVDWKKQYDTYRPRSHSKDQ